MKIELTKSATKALNSYDKPTRARIRAGIEGLTEKPPKGDIKPLEGRSDGLLRLRIGGYRIIYRYSERDQIEILTVMDIGSRGDIYKRR